MPKIPGGYYLKARIIQEKKIARAAPSVREIWDWLLREANHKDKIYKGYKVKRGQLFRSYKDIREGLAWNVGYRKMMYSEDVTKKSMKKLRSLLCITSTKAPGGVLITILNYDYYQNPKNYESTDESTDESTVVAPIKHQGGTTYNNKNEKNEKNEKNKHTLCPHLKIIDIYHKNLPMLPVVQSHTEDLKKRLRARWREDLERQTLEWWEWYFEGVSKCDFLVGKVKEWAASFYWLVGPKNMTKVLNGEYINREAKTKTDQAIEGFLNGQ